MSRGFVREGDQEEPPFVAPRAALPASAINYITPQGLELLNKEQKMLEEEYRQLTKSNEREYRRSSGLIQAKLNQLQDRILSARVIRLEEQPQDEVRFGALVHFKNLKTNVVQEFQIVGVDEANVAEGKISYLAPIAKALTGRKQNEIVEFNLGKEVRKLMILKISY